MKNEVNEWVALDNEGTIWAYCGPGTNNVLGLVIKRDTFWWDVETKKGLSEGYFSSQNAGGLVQVEH